MEIQDIFPWTDAFCDIFVGPGGLRIVLYPHGYYFHLRRAMSASSSSARLADCFSRGERMLTNVMLTKKRALTNIAMLQEESPAEPWIIALSDPPTKWRAQGSGKRSAE